MFNIDPQVGFCYTDVTVTEDLGHILHRSAFSQHICGKRMADSVYACVPLCWDSNACSASILMKFRIEIVMLTQWLKRCVMAQKDKSRGGLWAAILQIGNNRHT